MIKSSSHVGIIGVSLDSENMGVQALAHGAIKLVKKSIEDCELIIIDYGAIPKEYSIWTENEIVQAKLLNLKFSKNVFLKNNVAFLLILALLSKIFPSAMRKYILKFNKYLKEIYQLKYALAISGGDSFSDIYGIKRLLYVSFPQLIIITCGIPLIQLPQTIGPFKNKFSKKIANFILRRSRNIFVRDDASRELALKLSGHESQVQFCYDIGFILDAKKPKSLPESIEPKKENFRGTLIGLNISGLLYMGGYKRDNAFGLKINYPEFIPKLIDYLIEEQKCNLLLIPHVFGQSDQSESDWVVCSKVFFEKRKQFGNRIDFASGKYDQNEIKFIIGKCGFFIGSRMHSCIAALSQNVPTIAISYSRKFFGVFESLDLQELVIDPRVAEEEQILERIQKAISERSKLKEKILLNTGNVEKEIFQKLGKNSLNF